MGQPTPHPSAGAAPKICVRCGQDCSTRPRLKDLKGRYFCKECANQVAKATAAASPAAPGHQPDPLALDDQAPLPLEPVPAPRRPVSDAAAAEASGIRPCPICARPMARDEVICIGCGYNAQTGKKIAASREVRAAAPKGKLCTKCGYSLAGLKGLTCPECGYVNLPPDQRTLDREDSAAVARREYMKPLIMLLIGAGVMCAITAGSVGGHGALVYLIGLGIQVPIGVAVFWACCLMWMGFDAPMHLTALRLLGIYAVVDLVSVLAGLIPLPYVGWVIPGFFYIGMLSEMLDMEITDAFIVGLITFIVKKVMALFVLAWLTGLFGP